MREEIANLAYESMNKCRLIAVSTPACSGAIILSDVEAIAANIAKIKQLIEEQNATSS